MTYCKATVLLIESLYTVSPSLTIIIISSLPSLSATAVDVSSCPLSPPVLLLHKALQEGDQQYRGDPHSPQPPAGGSCVPGGTTRPSWLSVCCHSDSPSIPVCSGIPRVAGREKDVSEHVTMYM